MLSKEDYLKNIPKKRCGYGAIIINEDCKIMMLKTSYKDYYEIPGGATEKDEAPIERCQREIFEEIGLKLPIQKLLVFIPLKRLKI